MMRLFNLRHTYPLKGDTDRAIIDISEWSFSAGQQVLVRGVSGSGKTTLFNIIAGLLRPSQGEVWINGQSIFALSEADRDNFRTRTLGYIFQSHYLLPSLNAIENVMMPMAFAGVDARTRRRRAESLLEAVGLMPVIRHRPSQLSTGQRLRVAIARALANRPRLLLADEPTAALDRESAAGVMDVIQNECRSHEALLLVASHDPTLTARFDAILDLQNGRLSASTAALMVSTVTESNNLHPTPSAREAAPHEL